MGDEEKKSASLSLYSQNMWGVPTAPDVAKRFSKFEEVTESVPADVYMLQEVFPKRARKKFIIDPWRKKHPYFVDANQTDPKRFKLAGSGLVALSRLEIVKTEFLPYGDASLADVFANKGVLLVTVRLPNGTEFDIYNTHMQADYRASLNLTANTRRLQLLQLRDFISKKSGTNRNVIIMGDLNIKEKSQLYYQMVDPDGNIAPDELRFIDVVRQLYPDDKRYHLISFRNRNPRLEKRIDYILLRPANGWQWDKSQSSAEILDMLLADHNGTFAKLALVKE